MEIKYFNRGADEVEIEQVYGEKAVDWLYESSVGKLLSPVVCSSLISSMYGSAQDSSIISGGKVEPFIKEFNIDMNEYEVQADAPEGKRYTTFNNFFIRKFKEGARPFAAEKNKLPAFSEARYFGYSSLDETQDVPVKGTYMSAKAILNNKKWAKEFQNGPMLLARLCPVDYHRYHFPDNGEVLDDYRVSGKFHSVNPIALKKKNDVLCTNERHVTIIQTENFGKLAYVEVGAIMVGKIVQSYGGTRFRRGQEKGYFLFGGSTVMVFGEKDKWFPSNDILVNTGKGMETYIKLGDEVGQTV